MIDNSKNDQTDRTDNFSWIGIDRSAPDANSFAVLVEWTDGEIINVTTDIPTSALKPPARADGLTGNENLEMKQRNFNDRTEKGGGA